MKPAKKARRAILASLLVGSAAVSTGCTSGGMSLASVNPFSKPATPSLGEPPGISATLASAASGAGNQVSSVGTTAKSAWTKTSSAVAGIFKGGSDVDSAVEVTDPLSLANAPDSIGPEVFVANGQLWESTGDFGKAMESYTKALESEANHAPAMTSIARLHFRQGNHPQAADYFQRAIVQTPTDAGLHNDLGLTLNKMGDAGKASQSLQKALELAPGTSRYANNLASVKYEAGDAEGAYHVLASSNKPAVAHFNMAYLHFKGGQMTKARDHLGQVMEFEPQASVDPAIQRAVDRSRDMLAQISSATTPLAGSEPEAAIAAGNQFFNPKQQGSTVRQTSQSGTPKTGRVTPANSITTTMPQATPTSYGGAPASQALTPAAAAPAETTATRPMPTRPAMSAQPKDDAAEPSVPFSLPESFGSP